MAPKHFKEGGEKKRIKSMRKFQVKRRELVLQQPAAEGWLVPSVNVLQDTSEIKKKHKQNLNNELNRFYTARNKFMPKEEFNILTACRPGAISSHNLILCEFHKGLILFLRKKGRKTAH